MKKTIALIVLLTITLASHSVGDDGTNGDKLTNTIKVCYQATNYKVGDDGTNGKNSLVCIEVPAKK